MRKDELDQCTRDYHSLMECEYPIYRIQLNNNVISVRANTGGPPLVEVFVDDLPVEVPAGTNVMQACAEAGVEIPR